MLFYVVVVVFVVFREGRVIMSHFILGLFVDPLFIFKI